MRHSRLIILIVLTSILLTSCSILSPNNSAATATTSPPTATAFAPATSTPEPSPTPEPTATPTLQYPVEGYGPSNFPENVNPLTGLWVDDATILDRRPIMIKVQNLPRSGRPQFGLSKADLIYEYYSEQGTTRFAALYYGQDADTVNPIRSGRLIDVQLMRAYKPVLVFGSASYQIYDRLVNSEFGYRLILEDEDSCPAICRATDERGNSILTSDTSAVAALLQRRGIDNERQNLDGMLFKMEAPENGIPAESVTVRFSSAIYNRWDYDPVSGEYLRFSDAANDIGGNNPVYEQLTDAATKEPITADNIVVLFARHTDIDSRPEVEILEVSLQGSGPAYLIRDGQLYQVHWQRLTENDVFTLVDDAGNLVPFKPGQTWFEVMTASTEFDEANLQFTLFKDW